MVGPAAGSPSGSAPQAGATRRGYHGRARTRNAAIGRSGTGAGSLGGEARRTMRIEPYLFFPGNAEEALAFYQGIFGGEVVYAMRYGEAPPDHHPTPPEMNGKIMHATFTSGQITLMAADSMNQQPGTVAERVALSIALADPEEGRRIFDALAAGGTILAGYEKQFWGATFGMVTDRYGIDWMVNAGGS
jgi:PhnB protein